MKTIFSILLLCIFFLTSNAQIDFIEDSSKLYSSASSTLPMLICDLNGDMADDLVQISNGKSIAVNIQNVNNHVFSFTSTIATLGSAQWTCTAGDFNNDGLNEFLVAGFYDGARIYGRENPNADFELQQLTSSNFFAQNANTIDMNGDGHLDLFICDDDSESEVFLNNGSGTLLGNSNFLDMKTVPV